MHLSYVTQPCDINYALDSFSTFIDGLAQFSWEPPQPNFILAFLTRYIYSD